MGRPRLHCVLAMALITASSLAAAQGLGDTVLLSGTHHDDSTPGISGRDYFL